MDAEMWLWKKRKPDGFATILSSAACEWFLMFLLFLDATLWYVLMIFARYCELEPPCMLCSRLDHGLGRKKPGFYWSLLCTDHREEISSLVSCSMHHKFANIRSLCEECLTSTTLQRANITCSCCSRPLTDKSNTERLLELDFGASRANIRTPLPVSLSRTPQLIHKDSLKRVRDKFRGPLTEESSVGVGVGVGSGGGGDTISSVVYTKLKLSSDSESDFAQSEDDDGDDGKIGEHSLDKPPSDGEALESHAGRVLETKPLTRDRRPNPLSSDLGKASESSTSLPHMPAISVLSEILSVCSVPPLPGVTTPITQDAGKAIENGEPSKAKHTEGTGGAQPGDAHHFLEKKHMHHIKASVHGDKNQEKLDTNTFDPTKTHAPAKPHDVAEVSTSDLGLLSKGTSHRAHHRKDEDTHPRVPPVTASPKAKPHVPSFDITVGETEGEDIIEQLKRQIESDQSCLSALYKDLEEERNASAIAAEEAMAMITRLQEEKAALRMEALHYLRMMEEQAAYDSQALERANDLLAEREKELQDLEYELESYRVNYGTEQEEDDDMEEASDQENQAAAPTEKDLGESSRSKS